MPSRRWFSSARLTIVSCLLAVCPARLPAQQHPVIRVTVNLVRVIATVKNQSGQLVGALEKPDFENYDNVKPQEIAVFERKTEQPLSVAILIDTSGSTAKELKYDSESVSRLLKALFAEGNREDSAALFSFNWRVIQEQTFTHNH